MITKMNINNAVVSTAVTTPTADILGAPIPTAMYNSKTKADADAHIHPTRPHPHHTSAKIPPLPLHLYSNLGGFGKEPDGDPSNTLQTTYRGVYGHGGCSSV
jgi:hypothetical protein